MTFIDQHTDVFGVEPIRRVLTEHGCPMSTSTYYAAKRRPPSARAVRDAELDTHIQRIHATNYGVYGARKVWQQLLREGHRVARNGACARSACRARAGVRRSAPPPPTPGTNARPTGCSATSPRRRVDDSVLGMAQAGDHAR